MFSERSVERSLKRLVKLGVVVTGVFNARIYDRTLWYRLDYERLCERMSSNVGGTWEVRCPDDASLSITETNGDHAANCVPSGPTLLAPPIPEIPKQPEKKKESIFSKQSAKLTAKPISYLIKTGTAGEEKIKNNLKVLEEAAPVHNGKVVNKPDEPAKTVPASGWMNAGKALPEKLQKAAERGIKAAKAEAILKENQTEAEVHCLTSKPIALATYWQSHVATKHGNYQKPLRQKEIGMLKKLGKDLGDKAPVVLNFVLNNWWRFAREAAADAGTGSWPDHPNIAFLLKHHAVAANLLQSIAEQEQKKQLLMAKHEIQKHSQPVSKAPVKVKFTPEQKAVLINIDNSEHAEEFLAKVTEKYGENYIICGHDPEDAVLCDVAPISHSLVRKFEDGRGSIAGGSGQTAEVMGGWCSGN